jgi:hypothetical protein
MNYISYNDKRVTLSRIITTLRSMTGTLLDIIYTQLVFTKIKNLTLSVGISHIINISIMSRN